MILGLWLDQPIWAMFAWLAAPFAALSLALCLVSGLRFTRPGVLWASRGIVAPYFSAISVLLALLTGFVANDAWERQRAAARVVQAERADARAVHDLSLASVSDMRNIRSALQAYLDAVVQEEWPRMGEGSYSPEASRRLGLLLEAVAAPVIATEAGPATHSALLSAAMALRAARGERLALSDASSDETKWLVLLILAGLTLTALSLVHAERLPAQATSLILFSVAMVATLGLVALHERPFDGPLALSAEPLRIALAAMQAPP